MYTQHGRHGTTPGTSGAPGAAAAAAAASLDRLEFEEPSCKTQVHIKWKMIYFTFNLLYIDIEREGEGDVGTYIHVDR